MSTDERLKEPRLKQEMKGRKKVLKLAMENACELIALGNDPKIKNKIVPLAENHDDLMTDAWTLYYNAERKYYNYLKETASEQEGEFYHCYAEKISDEEEDYNDLSQSYNKVGRRLRKFIAEKTKN